MEKLNVYQICKISAVVKHKCDWIEYRQKEKFLFFTIQKEGWYNTILSSSGDKMDESEILGDGSRYIENKEVFFYPYLEFFMSNKTIFTKWFKTNEELELFVKQEELSVNKWIELDK